ncbi:MAG: hypothetical protein HY804_00615 [Nitrospinae bacterium]|nr:hypothetical protein [Nitrospinota bacterium]
MIRALAALASALALAAQDGAVPEKPDPLTLPAAITKNRALAAVLAAPPVTVRDFHLESPAAVARQALDEPLMLWRLAELLDGAPFTLEKAEEGAQWDVFSGGKRYVFTQGGRAGDTRVLSFTFTSGIPMAPGTRISGSGVAAMRVSEGKDGARLDFDLYMNRGGTRADKALPKSIVDYARLVRADLESIVSALDHAALEAVDDPEGILDEMREADDLLGAEEVEAFERIFIRSGLTAAGRK